MELFEDEPPAGPGNAPEYTVSELSGAVRRTVEGAFDNVRVRGEVGRVSRPGSGHIYLDLKDAGATLACVVWRTQVARLGIRPEEGMEVVATGRLTTFPGQSKYQMVIEALAPAGVGALMAMLEKRRLALAAEGLFDAGRKRALPYLPEVIGVVTSPTGAVIRDILHRLHDRFPRHVLVWPVAVQGPNCAPEVARAIAGFDALRPGGAIPRPDVLIVARGGGSVEDLWGFNEEAVVRAAAGCAIPLISAVGHETDTTLIDHVADRRAPTPTAAAEMAVPVRRELMIWAGGQGVRLARALNQGVTARGVRLRDLSRALPRAEALVAGPRQRLDWLGERLDAATRRAAERRQAALREAAAVLRPATLRDRVARDRQRVAVAARLDTALRRQDERRRGALREAAAALRPQTLGARVARDGQRCAALGRRLSPEVMAQGIGRRAAALAALVRTMRRDAALRYVSGRRERLDRVGTRFTGALVEAAIAGHRRWLDERGGWLEEAVRNRLELLAARLAAVDRVRETAGYAATLARGYAVVWSGERVVTGVAEAREAPGLSVQFADGRVDVGPARRRARSRAEEPEQGELF